MKRSRLGNAKGTTKSKVKKKTASEKEALKSMVEKHNEESGSAGDGGRLSKEAHVTLVRGRSDEERPGSPDPNCSICLCKMDDKSFTHSCFHMFCFTCLLEWSKVKAVCPLCKQPFKSIIHNIRSESDYDVYDLKDSAVAAVTTPGGADGLPADFFGNEVHALYPWHSLVAPFEYLPRFFNTTPPTWLQLPGLVFNGSDIRRRIYQMRRRAREIQLPGGMHYREISPAYFEANFDSDHIRRIGIWLNRELEVLCPESFERRQYLKDLIMNLLSHFHIQSEDFFEHLHQFFGIQTRIFINELYNFARSPLNITDTDRLTVYEEHLTPADIEVITLDRDDSDVEIVSPPVNNRRSGISLNEESLLNSSESLLLGPVLSNQGEDGRTESRIVSPVPGPSGLPGGPRDRSSSVPTGEGVRIGNSEPHVQEVSDCDSASTSIYDEIMVVGFDKPWRARTPISLSSDGSDVEVDDALGSSAPISNKTSPNSEQRLQLWLQCGSECRHSDDSRSTVHEDSLSSWSDLDDGSLCRRQRIEMLGCCDEDTHHCRRGHYSRAGIHIEIEHSSCNGEKNCYRFPDPFRSKRSVSRDRHSCHGDCCHGCSKRKGVNYLKRKDSSKRHRSRRLPEKNWSLRRHLKKRTHEDCGDSGVVVDVEQFCKASKQSPKRTAFKKHCSGHKSSTNKTEKSHEKETCANDSRDDDDVFKRKDSGPSSEATEPCFASADDHDAAHSERPINLVHEVRALDSLEEGSSKAQKKMQQNGNEEELGGSGMRGKCSSPSSSYSYRSESNSSSNARMISSDFNSDVMFTKRIPDDESITSGATIPSESAASSDNNCALEEFHHTSTDSINIDSEDSVQWLDPEKRGSPSAEERCNRHISVCSDILSSSSGSDIMQLSDEEESCAKGILDPDFDGPQLTDDDDDDDDDDDENCAEENLPLLKLEMSEAVNGAEEQPESLQNSLGKEEEEEVTDLECSSAIYQTASDVVGNVNSDVRSVKHRYAKMEVPNESIVDEKKLGTNNDAVETIESKEVDFFIKNELRTTVMDSQTLETLGCPAVANGHIPVSLSETSSPGVSIVKDFKTSEGLLSDPIHSTDVSKLDCVEKPRHLFSSSSTGQTSDGNNTEPNLECSHEPPSLVAI